MKPPTGARGTPGTARPGDTPGTGRRAGTTGETPERPGTAREVPEERLADRVADAVRACPDVASLAGGPVATYLSGRTVPGVAVRETEVEVAVVVRYGRPLAEIAAEVRDAVGPLAPGLPIHVRITDIGEPGKPRDDQETGARKDTTGSERPENDIGATANDAASPEGPGDTPASP
ncbi:hypothetical protein AB0B89_18085 [Sphaerisporangium sp. NPDC049002]|uniref:hypothetical protein n=1 Tax=unclassified Sphaerisporangium TaxID=2630420 RepID=UPI003407E988